MFKDPNSPLNRYLLDTAATAGFLPLTSVDVKAIPDIVLSQIAATAIFDALLYNLGVREPSALVKMLRDLVVRPGLTTAIIAYGHARTDLLYLGSVYLAVLAGIHATEIFDAVVHLAESLIERYKE